MGVRREAIALQGGVRLQRGEGARERRLVKGVDGGGGGGAAAGEVGEDQLRVV